jgi:hypothetical protein
MSADKTGGPVFPTYHASQTGQSSEGGMTLRDMIAEAMQSYPVPPKP